MNSKKGEAGIGTLILLIALVLVAAVAASVLLQTSGSLQSKALASGSKSKSQVSTQMSVIRIWAENGTFGSLNYIYADIRLGAGSDAVNFNTTYVDFFLSDASLSAIYNSTVNQCNISFVDTLIAASSLSFGVQYLSLSSTHLDGVLQQGEMVRLCFAPPRPLLEKEAFRFTILPKTGSLMQIKGSTPDILTEERINLFSN